MFLERAVSIGLTSSAIAVAANLAALPAEPQTVARYAATLAGTLNKCIERTIWPAPTAHKIVRDVLAGIGNNA